MDKVLHQWQMYKEFFDLYTKHMDAYWNWQFSNMRTKKGRELKRIYNSCCEKMTEKKTQIEEFEANKSSLPTI